MEAKEGEGKTQSVPSCRFDYECESFVILIIIDHLFYVR